MTDALVEAKVAALMALAEHGPTTDIQEVLVAGDGRGTIAPGAIDKMLAAALQAIEAAGYRVVPVGATDPVPTNPVFDQEEACRRAAQVSVTDAAHLIGKPSFPKR